MSQVPLLFVDPGNQEIIAVVYILILTSIG